MSRNDERIDGTRGKMKRRKYEVRKRGRGGNAEDRETKMKTRRRKDGIALRIVSRR